MSYTNKFTGLADIYDKYRPGYNNGFLRILNNGTSLQGAVIADIGAGTGLMTKELLKTSASKVYAIEPNVSMYSRLVGVDNPDNKELKVIHATAEDTTLPDNSVDLIVCAMSFHWFDVETFKKECQRILKPDGKVCLVWNSRREDNEVAQKSIKLFKETCPDFSGFTGGVNSGKKHCITFFRDFTYICRNAPTYFSLPDFIGRNLSMSYAPKPDDETFETFVKGLVDVYIEHNSSGLIEVDSDLVVFIGTV